MTKTNESKRDKFILLVIMLLSFLFVLGCGIKGNAPLEEPIYYEFSSGRYRTDSSTSRNMFYAAVNKENGSGGIFQVSEDGTKNKVTDFQPPISYYVIERDGKQYKAWVADGYSEIYNNKYNNATYALKLNLYDDFIEKYLSWNGIPDWEDKPVIEVQKDVISISIIPRVTETEESKNLDIRYRLKVYTSGGTYNKLFTQSDSVKYNKISGKRCSGLTCTLPRKLSNNGSSTFKAILAAELYDEQGIQMMLYYEGPKFEY